MKKIQLLTFILAICALSIKAQNAMFLPFDHNMSGLIKTLADKGLQAEGSQQVPIQVELAGGLFSYSFHQDQLYSIRMEKTYTDKRTSKEVYQAWMTFFRYKQATLLETISDEKDYRHFIYAANGELIELVVKQRPNRHTSFSLNVRYVPHMPMDIWGPYEALSNQGDLQLDKLLASEEIIHAGMRY